MNTDYKYKTVETLNFIIMELYESNNLKTIE